MKRLAIHLTSKQTVVVVALGIGLLGYYLAQSRLFPAPHPTYATARVARADIENVVLATGTLQPVRQVDVGTRATGQVVSLKVKLGDRVRAGHLLAEIDPKLAQSALNEAQAKLVDLEAQKRAAVAKLRKSRLEAEREHGLIKGAATSSRDVQAADAQRQVDEAGIVSLDAQIAQARSKIETETVNLSYTKIFAPIDGEVVAIVTQEGQTVVASQIVPVILKLAQLDVMTVKAQVSEADIDGVQIGQSASFVTMSDPTKRYSGKLRQVDAVPQNYAETSGGAAAAPQGKAAGAPGGGANTGPVLYSALFDVANPDRVLRAGKTAEVSILVGAAKGALAVPTAALGEQKPDGRVVVRVLGPDGKPQPRLIRVGVSSHALTEVLEGLKEGEEVVIGEEAASATGRGGGAL